MDSALRTTDPTAQPDGARHHDVDRDDDDPPIDPEGQERDPDVEFGLQRILDGIAAHMAARDT